MRGGALAEAPGSPARPLQRCCNVFVLYSAFKITFTTPILLMSIFK